MRFSLAHLLLTFSFGAFLLCLVSNFLSWSARPDLSKKADLARSILSNRKLSLVNLSFDWESQRFSWLVDVVSDGFIVLSHDEGEVDSPTDGNSENSRRLTSIPVFASESPLFVVINIERDQLNVCVNNTILSQTLSGFPSRESGGGFIVGNREGNGIEVNDSICLVGRSDLSSALKSDQTERWNRIVLSFEEL
jgi:hypothetical protein